MEQPKDEHYTALCQIERSMQNEISTLSMSNTRLVSYLHAMETSPSRLGINGVLKALSLLALSDEKMREPDSAEMVRAWMHALKEAGRSPLRALLFKNIDFSEPVLPEFNAECALNDVLDDMESRDAWKTVLAGAIVCGLAVALFVLVFHMNFYLVLGFFLLLYAALLCYCFLWMLPRLEIRRLKLLTRPMTPFVQSFVRSIRVVSYGLFPERHSVQKIAQVLPQALFSKPKREKKVRQPGKVRRSRTYRQMQAAKHGQALSDPQQTGSFIRVGGALTAAEPAPSARKENGRKARAASAEATRAAALAVSAPASTLPIFAEEAALQKEKQLAAEKKQAEVAVVSVAQSRAETKIFRPAAKPTLLAGYFDAGSKPEPAPARTPASADPARQEAGNAGAKQSRPQSVSARAKNRNQAPLSRSQKPQPAALHPVSAITGKPARPSTSEKAPVRISPASIPVEPAASSVKPLKAAPARQRRTAPDRKKRLAAMQAANDDLSQKPRGQSYQGQTDSVSFYEADSGGIQSRMHSAAS